jgi:hypothetical protein
VDLRLAESAIFGGVSLGRKGEALRSLVRIWVEDVKGRRAVPAGNHIFDLGKGSLKTLPTWESQPLRFALFPLQRSKTERERWGGRGNMPTRDIVTALRFTLRIRLDRWEGARAAGWAQGDKSLVVEALERAVDLFVGFGGLGGRTRRGFGGLALEGVARDGAPMAPVKKAGNEVWGMVRLLKAIQAERPDGKRPTLKNARVHVGAAFETPLAAQEEIVELLGLFRQGEGLGRAPRNPRTNRPGQSYWPEPDLLKHWAKQDRKQKVDFEHKPFGDGANLGAPRAAFGLPIVVKFQTPSRRDAQGDDTRANAIIVPAEAPCAKETSEKKLDRWASPMLFRVCRRGDQWVPVVITLTGTGAVPSKVKPQVGQGGVAMVRESGGTHHFIKDVFSSVDRISRDAALLAFEHWLREKHDYSYMNAPRNS